MRKWAIIVFLCIVLVVSATGKPAHAAHVTIHRDHFGVPHIYAQNLEGLYYGYGYAVAQDRLFQLEMLRRAYYGKVSEIFGAEYYALDTVMRRDNLTAGELKMQVAHLDDKYQNILQAFAAGINAYIDEAMADKVHKLPYEFHKLGFAPEHWTREDVTTPYLITLGWFMDLTNELTNAEFFNYLLQRYGESAGMSYFDDLVWGNDPGAITTMDTQDLAFIQNPASNQLARLDLQSLVASSKMYTSETDLTKKLLAGLGFGIPEKTAQGASKAFSYCVVVGSERSKTGEPLVMGGPQFGFWVPSQLYEVGLHAPGIDVVGSNLVGVIFLMFGYNQNASFGSTAGAGNLEDIFEEKLNPANPLQYMFNGEWRDMEIRVEKIQVQGESTPREEKVYITVHGPVVAQVDKDGDGKPDLAYSKKLACRDTYISGMQGFTELMLAETPEEFIAAGKRNTLSINFFYADKKGNIGFYHCGDYPERTQKEDFDPRFPTPGTGEYEWVGKLPQAAHPQSINPSNHMFVNWNNKPVATWSNDDLGGMFNWAGWSQDHRVTRINQLIAQKGKIGEEDLKEIIYDIADFDKRTLHIKEYLLSVLDDVTDPQLVIARDYLRSWDNHHRDLNRDGFSDAVGETIWNSWWSIVNETIFADELGPYWVHLLDNYAGYSVFYRALAKEDASKPMKNDYFNGQKWEQVLIQSLEKALANLTHEYKTSDMSKWLTPQKKMDFIPVILIGAPSGLGSVQNVNYMDRGTQNHIVRLKKTGPVGKNIVPPGVSGFINIDGTPADHFADQLDLFTRWEYKDLLLAREEVLLNAESTQILIYKPNM